MVRIEVVDSHGLSPVAFFKKNPTQLLFKLNKVFLTLKGRINV